MTKANYPQNPGYRANAPETSREAAEGIAPVARTIRANVFAVVQSAGSRGAIGFEVAEALGLDVHQVRSRLSELYAAKRIVPGVERREGAAGRSNVVWVLPEYGPPRPDDGQADMFAEAA